jgi:hypothetical protein
MFGGLTISSPRTPFNSFRALVHLKSVSRDSREIGSPRYRATFDYIVQNLVDSGAAGLWSRRGIVETGKAMFPVAEEREDKAKFSLA